VTKDELMHYYREMQTIRMMEERAKELYEMRKIRGFCHLYIGMVCVCCVCVCVRVSESVRKGGRK